MAIQVHIDVRVSKPWLWLAMFFERIARFCESRAFRTAVRRVS